ncbi:MAG TPA: M56 family metallopeptidase [Candidatus Acidoferrum sp.]|jgi:beta-lactamase regulating signal transducer with metallopeptidase domain
MISLAQLLSPEVMRLIALTLLHFLWQGTALAALGYAGMAMCRTAQTRYAVGIAMVILMAIAPAITYFTLSQETPQAAPVVLQHSEMVQSSGHASSAAKSTTPPPQQNVINYCFWLVELWFAGVVIFSVRSAGGVLLVEQLRRRESKQVREDLLALCLNLQRKLGLQRLVRFCECTRLDAPAVAGWLRPTILLPITALTGLSDEQLSSIIAHELAHIKRFDSLVNLFQVVVETLLFYHPAVWWLNKRVREERENCCDDMAVSVCGNPLAYAHALTRMAATRTSPRLLMAANAHPLAARVARLLGVSNSGGTIRRADLSIGVLCISASLLAGGAFLGGVRNAHAQQLLQDTAAQIAVPKAPVAPAAKLAPAIRGTAAAVSPAHDPVPPAKPAYPIAIPMPVPFPQSPASSSSPAQAGSSSYIDGLKAAGLDNLTVDQIIGLKIQGVTPEYVKEIRQLGLKVDADELIGMKIQGVTPEYVRGMRDATGQPLNTDELIGMKIQGITPQYVKEIHDLGIKVDADELIGLKVQGITPQYIQEMRKLDLKIDNDDVIGLKVQGVTPEYVQSIRALGLHPDTDELIGMKVQGIDADYLKKMQAAGFKLDPDDAISAKVMGITPEFIEKVRSHGFKDLSLHQLIGLKQSGVLD